MPRSTKSKVEKSFESADPQDGQAQKRRALAQVTSAASVVGRTQADSLRNDVYVLPALQAEIELQKQQQNLRALNKKEGEVRFKAAQESAKERLQQLSDLAKAAIDDQDKVTVHNPSDEYLEGSFAGEAYYLQPGDSEIISLKAGTPSLTVADALCGQLSGFGLTRTIEKSKRSVKVAEEKSSKRGLPIVTGRGGLHGVPDQEIAGLANVENPSAGERLQPRHLPNDTERWTPEQLANARIYPDQEPPRRAAGAGPDPLLDGGARRTTTKNQQQKVVRAQAPAATTRKK